MFEWMGNALKGAASLLGDGLVEILDWLLSGLITVLTKVIDAASGIFDVLDAVVNFFLSIKDLLLGLFPALFPWIPEDVLAVISVGLLAVLLAGFIKLVRK